MNLNKVFLIGRLTQDPKSITLPSGKTVATFRLATDRFFIDRSGQKRQETEFHNIVLFGKLAQIASQYLKKGSLCFLEGRLRTRTFEDKHNQKRERTEILVEKLQLGPKMKKELEKIEKELIEEEIPVIEEEEKIDLEEIPF